jgi:hypothetical protein
MVQVDYVCSWMGFDLPERFLQQEQPSKRERARGAKEVPDKLALFLDVKGGKFRQR